MLVGPKPKATIAATARTATGVATLERALRNAISNPDTPGRVRSVTRACTAVATPTTSARSPRQAIAMNSQLAVDPLVNRRLGWAAGRGNGAGCVFAGGVGATTGGAPFALPTGARPRPSGNCPN